MYIHTLSVEVTLSNVPFDFPVVHVTQATTEAGSYYPLNGEHLSLVAAHLHASTPQ